jgi:tRNA (guanine37-N1)-methyltransferase
VLLSGHHEEIHTWRRMRSQERGVVGPTARPPDPEADTTVRRGGGPDPFGPMTGDDEAPRASGPDPFGPMKG